MDKSEIARAHEMFLVGQVPTHRVDPLLDILAGFTAQQPQRRIERHVIYRPDRSAPEKEVAKGGQQTVVQAKSQSNVAANKDLSMTRLVKDLRVEDFDATKTSDDLWRHVFWELPTASMKEAILRAVMEARIEEKDPARYMQELFYRPVAQLLYEGHQYVHGNIVIWLHRILRFPEEQFSGPSSVLPPLDKFIPVDPANTTIMMATVEIAEASPELVNLALTELKAFKEQLKGVVELEVPDRLAFDTRVR